LGSGRFDTRQLTAASSVGRTRRSRARVETCRAWFARGRSHVHIKQALGVVPPRVLNSSSPLIAKTLAKMDSTEIFSSRTKYCELSVDRFKPERPARHCRRTCWGEDASRTRAQAIFPAPRWGWWPVAPTELKDLGRGDDSGSACEGCSRGLAKCRREGRAWRGVSVSRAQVVDSVPRAVEPNIQAQTR